MHRKRHRCQGLFPKFCPVAGKNEIVHIADEHFDFVGIFIQDAMYYIIGCHSTSGFSFFDRRQVEITPLVNLFHLGMLFGQIVLKGFELVFIEFIDRNFRSLQRATFIVRAADKTCQRMNSHSRITAPDMHGTTRPHPDTDIGCSFAHATGYTDNLFCRHSREFSSFLRSHVLDRYVPPFDQTMRFLLDKGSLIQLLAGLKLVLAVLEVADKTFIPESLAQYDMSDTKS